LKRHWRSTKKRGGGDYPEGTQAFHCCYSFTTHPLLMKVEKSLSLNADQIALPQSVIVAIFVREQALGSIQIHRLQINGCSLLRAIIQNPIVHLEPVYSVLVECLGATSAKHKHDEGD